MRAAIEHVEDALLAEALGDTAFERSLPIGARSPNVVGFVSAPAIVRDSHDIEVAEHGCYELRLGIVGIAIMDATG